MTFRNWFSGKDLRHSSRGFTLLEIMICLAIMAIAIPAFLAAIAQNVQLEAMNSELNIAVSAASGVIEEVHSLGYSQVDFTNLPQTFEADGLGNDGRTVTLTNAAGSSEVGRVQIFESNTGKVKTVEVEVVWRGRTGEERSIRLMTEVTNY